MQIEITSDYLVSQGLTKTIPQRFWKRVNKTAGCWMWTGLVSNHRGNMYGGPTLRHVSAPRVSWILHRGPIPIGMSVLHTCDIPLCVNPDHLWLGTQKDNIQDMINKGRRANTAANLKGENNPSAKLTKQKVLEIVQHHANGLSNTAISKVYGITDTCVSHIVNGKTWSWVTGVGTGGEGTCTSICSR